jgi:hypothetical protein
LQKLGGAKVIISTVTSGAAMSAVQGGLAINGTLILLGVDKSLQVAPTTLILGRRSGGRSCQPRFGPSDRQNRAAGDAAVHELFMDCGKLLCRKFHPEFYRRFQCNLRRLGEHQSVKLDQPRDGGRKTAGPAWIH